MFLKSMTKVAVITKAKRRTVFFVEHTVVGTC